MERMNFKKVGYEIRDYVLTRIIDLKEKAYEVKKIGELLNGNSLPAEKIRGRKFGEGRILQQAESELIRTAITEHTPDEFKLPYSLWSREAIQELIEQKYQIKMPLTTNRQRKQQNKMNRQ